MVAHPSPGHEQGTLVNALLHHCSLPAIELTGSMEAPASLLGLGEFTASGSSLHLDLSTV